MLLVTTEYIAGKELEMLTLVNVNEPQKRMKQYPFELSGGMRQRVMIAMALACEPDILIADEPTTALDVTIQAQILELMQSLQKELGMAILFITHDLGTVAKMCDRVAVMYLGKIVETGTAKEIYKNPQHPYTRSLLSAIPLPDPVYEKQRTRIHYNPIAEHDYSVYAPTIPDITPGHFVHCNDAEEEKYKQLIK